MPTGNGDRSPPPDGAAQLGGVRADFVANLGRRLAEVRRNWAVLEADPGSPRARDEVRRRIHALAVRARVGGLTAMANRLDQAERCLERAASVGGIDPDDVVLFRALFEELPALAWHEVAAPAVIGTKPPPSHESLPVGTQSVGPLAVLVVGSRTLASSIGAVEPSDRMSAFECEQTDDIETAPDLARAFAPDVILVDADLPGADRLVDLLAADALTRPVPVVVIGSWEFPDQAAPFLAKGIAQALARPVAPTRLRSALTDATSLPRPVDTAVPALEGTVVEIADRLADQIRRGLVDALLPASRDTFVQLGDGTEALAAVWGAVARVREILAARSGGAVRFSSDGPIGAVPLAPWLDLRTDPHLARREQSPREPLEAPARLDGRRVLVVDDDPAVRWFFSDLFRAAGAEVVAAHDGARALDHARSRQPDLVVSDILMPGLDGFALCRALKNDVVLRDVPVVLLSWKEDLLQRVRDLGASADGYLRKEASSAAILRNVHELLRPRIALEERLRTASEVRGRLDGWTAPTLLRLVAVSRGDGRVAIRDASYLYELTIRAGHLIQASRTSLEGASREGESALISLPGVTSGRFQVSSIGVEETGTDLDSALAEVITRARAACDLLAGPRLAAVGHVRLRQSELALHATPEPARTWLQALADGIAPRELIESHGASIAVLERLLADAAMRGAVDAIVSPGGADLMQAEAEALASRAAAPVPAPTLAPEAPAPAPVREGPAPAASSGTSTPLPEDQVDLAVDALLAAPTAARPSSLNPGASFSDPPPNYLDASEAGDAPTSLAEAVIREVADARGSLPPPSSRTPFLVDVHELRPRTRPPGPMSGGSLPPDAIVPGADPGDGEAAAAEPSVPSVPTIPPAPATPTPAGDIESAKQILPAPTADEEPEPKAAATGEAAGTGQPATAPGGEEPEDEDDDENEEDDEEPGSQPSLPPAPGLVAKWWPTVLMIAIVVAAVVALAKLATPNHPTGPTGTQSTAPSAPSPSVVESSAAPEAPAPNKGPRIESELSLPEDMRVAPGMAVLEIRPGHGDAIVFIDGLEVGSGDVVRSVVPPGDHDVIVEKDGVELRATVRTTATRRTRVSMEGLWAP